LSAYRQIPSVVPTRQRSGDEIRNADQLVVPALPGVRGIGVGTPDQQLDRMSAAV
jgi:hypothetical protein